MRDPRREASEVGVSRRSDLFGQALAHPCENCPAEYKAERGATDQHEDLSKPRKVVVVEAVAVGRYEVDHRIESEQPLTPLRNAVLHDLGPVDDRSEEEPHLHHDRPEVAEVLEIDRQGAQRQRETRGENREENREAESDWDVRKQGTAGEEQDHDEETQLNEELHHRMTDIGEHQDLAGERHPSDESSV